MKHARILVCFFYAAYLLAAIAFPHAMYVDRFLLKYSSWAAWAPVQLLPSMYTTEIVITGPDGHLRSVPHHPARIFFLFDRSPRCESYNISVRYRSERGSRDYLVCNGRVEFDRKK